MSICHSSSEEVSNRTRSYLFDLVYLIYGVNPLSTFKTTVIILGLIGIWVSLMELGDFGD